MTLMDTDMAVDLILVPQGAEYANVIRGLRHQGRDALDREMPYWPRVCSIPIGLHSLSYVQHSAQIASMAQKTSWHGKTIILMGLGGSLSPHYDIGDIVISKSVRWATSSAPLKSIVGHDELRVRQRELKTYIPTPALVDTLYQSLRKRAAYLSQSTKVGMVHGITSDRIINSPQEKQDLAQRYDAELVEMEGAYILDFFQQQGANVAMVRVISDRYDRNIPDLNGAIDPNGNLKAGMMMATFLRHPIAAAHLIQGSLKGLNHLKLIAGCCASLERW